METIESMDEKERKKREIEESRRIKNGKSEH